MPIHFAAARPVVSAFLGVASRNNLAREAANDNCDGRPSTGRPSTGRRGAVTSDRMLRDAIKHFATHGLGAAEQARREAERGYHAGEVQTYRYWLEICGKFDRRMAAALVRKFGA